MPPRNYPPASLRYLKARLLNLARPGFWGTAIFLSLVGLSIKEYWAKPDFFTSWQKNQVASNQPVNSSLSAEDKAIAADIDNLPVLFSDVKQAIPPTESTSEQNQKANNKGLLDTSKNQTSASYTKSQPSLNTVNSTPPAKTENPFLVQADKLLQLANFQSAPNFLGVDSLTPSSAQQGAAQTPFGLGIGLVNKTNSSQNVAPVNPLQTALNPSTNQDQPLNGTTSTQINPFGQSLVPTNSLPSQILPSTGLSANANNPVSTGTGYPQPGLTNIQPNTIPGTGYPQPGLTNLQPNTIPGTGYPQPGLTNLQPNSNSIRDRAANILNRYRYNNRSTNLNSGQALPSIRQPTPVVPPNTSPAPINIAPYYTPTPNQGIVNSATPVVPYNYGNSSLPQSNLSSPRQIPGQYIGGEQINRY